MQTFETIPQPKYNASLGGLNCSQLNKMGLTGMPLDQEPYLNLSSSDGFILGRQSNQSATVDPESLKLASSGAIQNSLNNSLINKSAAGRSQLFHLLNEQQAQNRKVIERNKKLLGRISSNITSTATSIPSSPNANLSLNQPNYSCLENGCYMANLDDQSLPLNTIGINPHRTCLNLTNQSFTAGPPIHDRFWPREKNDMVHNHSFSRNHVTPASPLNYRTIQTEAQNHECCQSQIKSISALQNHISLLEQENGVLKHEIVASKQQEAQTNLLIRQLQLEIQELSSSKDSLIIYNQQLLDQLQATTTEANQTIANLSQLNQELNLRAKNYQSAADKLTAQLINLTKVADVNVKKSPTLHEDCMNRSDLYSFQTNPRSYDGLLPNSNPRIEPRIVAYKGNSKLKADLSYLNQRIDSLQKDNEILLKEQAIGKENLNSANTLTRAYSNHSMTPQLLTLKIQNPDNLVRPSLERPIHSRKRLDLRDSRY